MTAPPLVEARGVVHEFALPSSFLEPRRSLRALRGVGLSVRAGESFCVVGESGCGKTTLGRIVMGLVQPTAGEIWFDGARIDTLSNAARRPYRRRMQMVFQNPYGALNPRFRVLDALTEPLKVLEPELSAAERRTRMEQVLLSVGGQTDWTERFPHEFSGGQRQRIAIARALITNPDFIVADEPVSALDVSVQAQVLNLMVEAQEARGLSYLFITHDLSVVRHFASRVAVMYFGAVVELAEAAALFERPRHPYTTRLLSAAPSLSGAGMRAEEDAGEPPDPAAPPQGCPFRARCPHAFAPCAETDPPLQTVDGRHVACHAVAEGRI